MRAMCPNSRNTLCIVTDIYRHLGIQRVYLLIYFAEWRINPLNSKLSVVIINI